MGSQRNRVRKFTPLRQNRARRASTRDCSGSCTNCGRSRWWSSLPHPLRTNIGRRKLRMGAQKVKGKFIAANFGQGGADLKFADVVIANVDLKALRSEERRVGQESR